MHFAARTAMSTIVVGLVADAHLARGLVRALEDDGFDLDDLDVSGGVLTELLARGVPDEEAGVFAEGVRRGGMLVLVRAQDDDAAAEAAETMAEHGVVDIDACASRWQSQPDVAVEQYALVFGEYPAAPGRIYHDPRTYNGPERRVRDEPYTGINRRAI
jgi:hypothetical protein